MHYLIDGYNLLFRMLHKGNSLQSQREFLIQDLYTKIQALHLDVTLVFDSIYQKGEGTRSHFKEMEIIYTGEGVSADDYIIKEVKKSAHPIEEIVVTSDTELAYRAKRLLAKTERVEEFIQKLNHRYQRYLKLQQTEEKKLPTLLDMPAKKSVPKSKEPVTEETLAPSSSVTAEECTDYYLDVFQKEFEALPPPPPKKADPKTKKTPKRKKPPRFEPKEETGKSDMDRWFDVFTKNKDEDDLGNL